MINCLKKTHALAVLSLCLLLYCNSIWIVGHDKKAYLIIWHVTSYLMRHLKDYCKSLNDRGKKQFKVFIYFYSLKSVRTILAWILHVKRLETQKCLSHPLLCKRSIFLERQNQYKQLFKSVPVHILIISI